MGLLKTILIGAAVYSAVKYVTKKDINGKTIIDDLKEKAPQLADRAKRFKEDLIAEHQLGRDDRSSDLFEKIR